MKRLFKHLLLVAVLLVTLTFSAKTASAATSFVPGTYTVTAKSLYVRSGAGSTYKALGTVHKGDVYSVTDSKTVSGKVWGKITFKSKTGWVSMSYLKLKKAAATTTTTSTTTTTGTTASTGTTTTTDTTAATSTTTTTDTTVSTSTTTTTVKNGFYWENKVWKYYKNGVHLFTSNPLKNAYNKIKNKKSGSSYYVVIDRSVFAVFVFKKNGKTWEPIKGMRCSVGKASTPTPAGTWTIFSRWKILGFPNGSNWEYYPVEFSAKYHACFHSILYYPTAAYKNSASKALAHASEAKVKNGRLGAAISHGCVRLSLENAAWIWKNLPNGTKVLVY